MTTPDPAAAIRARLDALHAAHEHGPRLDGHTATDCWCRGTHAEGLHGFYQRDREVQLAAAALLAVLDLCDDTDAATQPDMPDVDCKLWPADILRTIAAALGLTEREL